MFALTARVFAALGSSASLVALAVSLKAPNKPVGPGAWALIGVASFLGVIAIGWEIDAYARHRPWIKKPSKVKAYLRSWIETGSRVAIFTRDMSWVDDEIEDALRAKATAGELILILPKATDLSHRLARAGATVISYPDLAYTIRSRFTIIHHGRTDTAVAVGYRVSSRKHRIDTFHAGEPAFYLAQDLAEVMTRISSSQE